MTFKSAFVFRIIIGSLFIGQYFFGFDGHGHGAGNIVLLLLGVAFAGYGIFGLIQRAILIKKAKTTENMPVPTSGVSITGVRKAVKASLIFLIVIGVLMGSQYFLGFDGHGRGAGNIVLLLFGVAFAGYGIFGLINNAAMSKTSDFSTLDRFWTSSNWSLEQLQGKTVQFVLTGPKYGVSGVSGTGTFKVWERPGGELLILIEFAQKTGPARAPLTPTQASQIRKHLDPAVAEFQCLS